MAYNVVFIFLFVFLCVFFCLSDFTFCNKIFTLCTLFSNIWTYLKILYGLGETVGFVLKTGKNVQKMHCYKKIQNLNFRFFDVLYAFKVGFFSE